jgi:heparan-sulfate lyase
MTTLTPPSKLPTLQSLPPGRVFDVLNTPTQTLSGLLAHFRNRISAPVPDSSPNPILLSEAENILNHILPLGTGESVQFGHPIDFAHHPITGNVPGMVPRLDPIRTLAQAYAATGDRRFSQKAVEWVTLFFQQHPLSHHDRHFPDNKNPRRWMWMDITGARRAQRLLLIFKNTLHSPDFTPDFLAIILAGIYDHAHLFHLQPNPHIFHNMSISEQSALADIASQIPEFKESQTWFSVALSRLEISLNAQINHEGAHTEWCPGYHINILGGTLNVIEIAAKAHAPIPASLIERTSTCARAILAIATPDDDLPAFGDTKHKGNDSIPSTTPKHVVSGALECAARHTGVADFAAFASGQRHRISANPTQGLPDAGLFAFRSDWSQNALYIALHNPPGPENFHAEPHSLTFELCYQNRWLMNDTGYYTYGQDGPLRQWHRQTRAHQTFTLDDQNSAVAGSTLLWQTAPNLDILVAQNAAYPNLTHRRTVWFVDKRYFVFLDEALTPGGESGDAPGQRAIHFQFAPALENQSHVIAPTQNFAYTRFPDANVALWTSPAEGVTLHSEEGWHAYEYFKRTPRPAMAFHHPASRGSVRFLTIIAPYVGTTPPALHAAFQNNSAPGDAHVEIQVTLSGQTQPKTLTRTLRA